MEVVVVRSARRRKTVEAREVDGVLHVSIPATMTQAEEARWVEEMRRRIDRKLRSREVDLDARVDALVREYNLPRPTSVRWVDNQERRWGSCSPSSGAIRISSRIAGFPPWVIDYVLVHELCHLWVHDHSRAFWATVSRYPKAERARGFLIAKGMEPDD